MIYIKGCLYICFVSVLKLCHHQPFGSDVEILLLQALQAHRIKKEMKSIYNLNNSKKKMKAGKTLSANQSIN